MPKLKELQETKPTWLRENLVFALRGFRSGSSDEYIKRMTLLSMPCVKCGLEMGEHKIGEKVMCPQREQVTITGPDDKLLDEKEASTFLRDLQKGVFYIGQ